MKCSWLVCGGVWSRQRDSWETFRIQSQTRSFDKIKIRCGNLNLVWVLWNLVWVLWKLVWKIWIPSEWFEFCVNDLNSVWLIPIFCGWFKLGMHLYTPLVWGLWRRSWTNPWVCILLWNLVWKIWIQTEWFEFRVNDFSWRKLQNSQNLRKNRPFSKLRLHAKKKNAS